MSTSSQFYKKSYNKTLKPHDVLHNPDLNWDYYHIIDTHLISKNKNKKKIREWFSVIPVDKIDFSMLSLSENITPEWITCFPDANWDYTSIIEENVLIHPQFYNKFKKEDFFREWFAVIKPEVIDADYFSDSYYICWEWLTNYPDVSWNFEKLSDSDKLDGPKLRWLLKYPDEGWDWEKLVLSEYFDITWILKLSDKPWPWHKIIWKPEELTYSIYQELKLRHKQLNPENFRTTKNLTRKWILELPSDSKVFKCISSNPNLDIRWIVDNPDLPWDFQQLSHNHNLDLNYQILEKFQDRDWDFRQLSQHKNLSLDWIILFQTGSWDLNGIISRTGYTVSISKLFTLFPDYDWDYPTLSKHYLLNLGVVAKYPDKPWDFMKLSKNVSLTYDFIYQFKDRKWSFTYLSKHKNLELEWISLFAITNWDFSRISENYNVQLDWLQTYPVANWDFGKLSNNQKLDLDWLLTYPDASWDFKSLSSNHNLTSEWLAKFPDKPWNGNALSYNPNFSVEWFEIIDVDWNLDNIFSRGKKQIYLPLLVQIYQPQIEVAKYITGSRYTYKWKDKKIKPILLPLVLLNPNNKKYLEKYEIKGLDLWNGIKLTKQDKEKIVEIYRQGVTPDVLEPYMLDNLNMDLQVSDLSGDMFYLPNWFQSPYILKLFWDTYPDLGKIDLLVTEGEEQYLASQLPPKDMKSMLLSHRDGSFAMLIYPE